MFLFLKRNPKRITFDLDASLIESYKKSAKRTYKGFKGYDPLLMVIAEYNLVYMGIFREGNIAPQSNNLSLLRACYYRLPGRMVGPYRLVFIRVEILWLGLFIFRYCCWRNGW